MVSLLWSKCDGPTVIDREFWKGYSTLSLTRKCIHAAWNIIFLYYLNICDDYGLWCLSSLSIIFQWLHTMNW
jgi:hypothetical protein